MKVNTVSSMAYAGGPLSTNRQAPSAAEREVDAHGLMETALHHPYTHSTRDRLTHTYGAMRRWGPGTRRGPTRSGDRGRERQV